jgi:hypothetical protein
MFELDNCEHCGAPLISCERCGKRVAKTGPTQRYCPPCGDLVRREQNRQNCRRYYKKLKAAKES